MPKNNDDLFDFADSFDDDELLTSIEPKNNEGENLKIRLSTEELLERFKLKLMGLYKTTKKVFNDDGDEKLVTEIKQRKNVKPLVTKQGAEEIISFIESAVNTHTVMGNFSSEINYNHRMTFIAKDVVSSFMDKRRDWKCTIANTNYIISETIILIEIFLTRPIGNEERKGLNETYKETTHRDIKPEQKENILQRIARNLGG